METSEFKNTELKNREYNQRGFTLLEMLLALAIVIGLLALAYPTLDKLVQSGKLKHEGHNLVWTLRALRQEAMSGGRYCGVKFYPYDGSYTVYGSSEIISKKRELDSELHFAGTTTFAKWQGTPACIFTGSGTPLSGGTIVLKNNQGEYIYIIVSAVGGRVRISSEPPHTW